MIQVKSIDTFVVQGDQFSVQISHPQITSYRQIQIDVFEVGVTNPTWCLGTSTTPMVVGDDVAEIVVPSEHLTPGIYEIRAIRLHDAIDNDPQNHLTFLSGRDMERLLFEVGDRAGLRRTPAELVTALERREADLEDDFLSPVDIRSEDGTNARWCCVFVFVRDVLVGTQMRFKHFEVIPTQRGLDAKDQLEFVNAFFRENTLIGLTFPYEEGSQWASHRSNPACAVHFPTIIASTLEEARDYCVERTNLLLLALSLTRDAGGIAFEVVVIDRDLGSAKRFPARLPYVGNILTGQFSGERVETVETYLSGIDKDPMNNLLVGLYREARRDRNRDFQYLRLWQILEIMAESCNYDPASFLVDYEGEVMLDRGEPRRCKAPVHIVFSLFRDNHLGTTDETWEKVNVWFAFRTAVAHHGSIARYAELSRPHVKAWADRGYEEIQRSSEHDRFLWELKEDTKLLLMKRLATSDRVLFTST